MLHVLWNLQVGGGAERAVFQLVRGQRSMGIAADVLVCASSGYYGGLVVASGARVIELGQRHSLDLSRGPALRSLLANYSIAHFHSLELGLIRLASRTPTLRSFYTHRAGVFAYGLKQSLKYHLAGSYLRRFAGVSGNTRQAATAAAHLFHLPSASVPITYNGIDFSLLAPVRSRDAVLAELDSAPAEVKRIGTSANLREWKRIDLLLKAVGSLRSMPIQCVIIGDGPDRVRLGQLTDKLGIADKVIFTGRTSHVGDYLQALDLFVLPSGPEESFGNAAVEAMGFGLPVVVFADGGGLLEHIDNERTGFVVQSVSGLEARIRELVHDSVLRGRVGAAARQQVLSRYTVSAMVEAFLAFYQGRLSQAPA